jgi:putative transposase
MGRGTVSRKSVCDRIWHLWLIHAHPVCQASECFVERRAGGTARINARNRWTGHIWQGRFGSVVMDEGHLAHAVRYVSLNPVRARLVARAEEWPWSSVRAHLSGHADGLTDLGPVLERFPDFASLLETEEDAAAANALRLAETTGRPLGAPSWIATLETAAGRALAPQKRGPKSKLSKLSP